jgi:predicted ATPase
MYIHRFRVRNYMIHQDTSIDLQPLTVLVGPNGGGKSALFDAMLNFSMLSRGNIRQAFGPYPYSFAATRYRGASDVSRIGFEIIMSGTRDSDQQLAYTIDYSQQGFSEGQPAFMIFNEKLTRRDSGEIIFDRSDPDSYAITQELRLDNDRGLFSAIRVRAVTAEAPLDPLLEYVTQQISRFNKFRLDPFALAAPSRLPELGSEPLSSNAPRIGYHGEDLASTLYYLSETGHESLDVIRNKVRELVPEFQDFEFSTVGTDRIAFGVQYADRREMIPSVRLSSGMLIYIGLIVLVSTPNRPPVLMIEEPENGLTPQAVKAFYQAVRHLAFNDNADDRSQVLLSSHSPFVICEAWNGEDRDFIHQVRVADGKAVVRKFSTVVEDQGIHLGKDSEGQRTHLSLKNAEEIMSGFLSS